MNIEIPSVKPYLPPSALSGTTYSYDPLPPPQASSTFYNEAYFSPLHTSRSSRRPPTTATRGGGGGGIPGGAMAQQMRDQLAAMLGFGGNDPVPMTDELREELMRDLEALGHGQGGGVGAFPGMEDDDEDYEDEDDEEGAEREEAAVGGGGMLARLAAMLGGGGGRAE